MKDLIKQERKGAPTVERKFTRRGMWLGVSGLMVLIGAAGFIIYFFTMNAAIGAPCVIMGVAGVVLYKHFWDKSEDIVKKEIGLQYTGEENCFNIYSDRVLFETIDFDVYDTDNLIEVKEAYPWECENTRKHYQVNICNKNKKESSFLDLRPLALPDQTYYNPTLFRTRVIGLPAHRRIFKRKEKIGQVLKTVLLVAVIAVLWVLILTTTGGG